MAPSANDLFLNLWVKEVHSGEFDAPGSAAWSPKVQFPYWARVWRDCLELSRHLQQFEEHDEAVGTEFKQLIATPEAAEEPDTSESILTDAIEQT